ncbi:multiubiquitin domain-containing protein [Dactylosporangium sp. NPDC000555]|uniref:multiubiquitin domain-containing protein n=1 Tax=Dactylosporangium sp. NPDC000555 TaxID=3154260 RepID=UPI00332D5367
MTALKAEQQNDGARPPRTVEVIVNTKPVEVPEREVTGLEIKQAAIAQGVDIQLTFQLSVHHGGKYHVIGDTDTVRVHRHEDFLCVDKDDNS